MNAKRTINATTRVWMGQLIIGMAPVTLETSILEYFRNNSPGLEARAMYVEKKRNLHCGQPDPCTRADSAAGKARYPPKAASRARSPIDNAACGCKIRARFL